MTNDTWEKEEPQDPCPEDEPQGKPVTLPQTRSECFDFKRNVQNT